MHYMAGPYSCEVVLESIHREKHLFHDDSYDFLVHPNIFDMKLIPVNNFIKLFWHNACYNGHIV